MCGVYGFFSTDPTENHFSTLKKIALQSRIRGLHSYGVSYYRGKEIHNFKSYQMKDIFSRLSSVSKVTPHPLMLIGHNRYSTSGDCMNQKNNQPMTLDDVSVVFNGVISMQLKTENEKRFEMSLTFDNDVEIFARKVLEESDWEGFVRDGEFSFAGVFLNKGKMIMIRNEKRPLYYAKIDGGIFIASTKNIFKRAIAFNDPTPVPPGVAIDVKTLCN